MLYVFRFLPWQRSLMAHDVNGYGEWLRGMNCSVYDPAVLGLNTSWVELWAHSPSV